MVDLVVQGGQAGGYSGGAQVVGTAPAKVTAVTLRTQKGIVKFVIALPVDKNFASYSIYALDNAATTDPGFPGGSPILVDTASKTEDDTCVVGVRRHYWIVTLDRHGVPLTPVAANAFYAGNIVPTGAVTLLAGTS